uniref:Uncharacterized protein n=1 Tax=Arundo donax TaxID=35708 RepID=A0A0A9HIZ8_ARUDO
MLSSCSRMRCLTNDLFLTSEVLFSNCHTVVTSEPASRQFSSPTDANSFDTAFSNLSRKSTLLSFPQHELISLQSSLVVEALNFLLMLHLETRSDRALFLMNLVEKLLKHLRSYLGEYCGSMSLAE